MTGAAGFFNETMERLASIDGVTSRAMFGGYGIFHEGTMFALISKASLYFKVDDSNFAAYEQAGSQRFQLASYYEVPADVFEDTDKLTDWASTSIAIAHAIAAKKKQR